MPGEAAPVGDPALEPVACDAAIALNLATADLLLPHHIFKLFTGHEDAGRISGGYATAARRLAMQVLVVNLYRLWEVRTHLLCPWLFSEAELLAFGLPEIEAFVVDWSSLLIVRHQFAGHMLKGKPDRGKPGQLLPPERFGQALQGAGLLDAEAFLGRVEAEIIPAVERIRAELFRRWPATEDYVRRVYPEAVSRGAGGHGTGAPPAGPQ